MAVPRERPYLNAHFLVDLGARGADPRAPALGFSEVVFPPFVATPTAAEPGATAPAPLVLRRGVTGHTELYAWWDKSRRGKAPARRTVTVSLLAEDRATVVMAWRFLNARPLALHYAPLSALDGGVLVESLEVAFDGVEIG